MSSKLVISMSASYPTRGPGFVAFSVGDMVSGNRTILLCILKGLQMRLSCAELPLFSRMRCGLPIDNSAKYFSGQRRPLSLIKDVVAIPEQGLRLSISSLRMVMPASLAATAMRDSEEMRMVWSTDAYRSPKTGMLWW